MPKYYTTLTLALCEKIDSRNSMHDTLARGVLEVSSETEQPHTIHLEKPEQNDPGDILMVVDNESTSWFHVAIMGTNTHSENAKEVCAQAILYKNKEDDPDLFYSVYDSLTQTVLFCLCSSSRQDFEDISCYSMHREADKIVKLLKAYIVSNTEVLHR
jgi:hypothetical protein